ncbi:MULTISPECIES: hypothetical protein [unclassified Streptomyces]|uniref:hypothetical protein n=1 Tax=unclassified Streptomyces TaxID=2593676 RepID=UPI0010574B03|nr:hypothetical protein [Streptomyces sp. DH-12]
MIRPLPRAAEPSRPVPTTGCGAFHRTARPRDGTAGQGIAVSTTPTDRTSVGVGSAAPPRPGVT